jgi:SnoaL-like domain
MSDDVELLRRVYELFNRREIERVLAAMHPDVIWANGMEGGHVHGRDEVHSYWKRQWAIIDPHVEPVEISPNSEGELVVKVHQVVHDPKGNVLADRLVMHVFQIQNGLIQRLISAMYRRLPEPYHAALPVCLVWCVGNWGVGTLTQTQPLRFDLPPKGMAL